ncbi:hypothetical protein RB195_004504 [Necator americanus]|uniref:SCP domain-containing protein n=1 Tax=Necator americanus TaxID=51031 RepID=A0ABR1BIF4_NECAM
MFDEITLFGSLVPVSGIMFAIYILILLVVVASADYECRIEGKVPRSMKKQIVDLHNQLRQQLANGEVQGATGKLPKAKNMPMLQWDCDMEALAAERLKNGRLDVNFLGMAGYNDDAFTGRGCVPKPLDFEWDFGRRIRNWWKEAESIAEQEGPVVRLPSNNQIHFGQMAFANVTGIGCNIYKSGRVTFILCLYNSRIRANAVIYEKAEAKAV